MVKPLARRSRIRAERETTPIIERPVQKASGYVNRGYDLASDLQKPMPSEPVPVLGNPNRELARVEGYAVARHQNGIHKIEESAAVRKLNDRRLPGHSKLCSAIQSERA